MAAKIVRTLIFLVVIIVISASIPGIVERLTIRHTVDDAGLMAPPANAALSLDAPSALDITRDAETVGMLPSTSAPDTITATDAAVPSESLTAILYIQDPFTGDTVDALSIEWRGEEWVVIADKPTAKLPQSVLRKAEKHALEHAQCRSTEPMLADLAVDNFTFDEFVAQETTADNVLFEIQLQLPVDPSGVDGLPPFMNDPLWLRPYVDPAELRETGRLKATTRVTEPESDAIETTPLLYEDKECPKPSGPEISALEGETQG